MIKVNILEFVEELMDMGLDEETALREYNAMFNPEYDPDDYDDPYGANRIPDDYYGDWFETHLDK